jgi:broad specificity phosphatase PhoE
MRSGLSPRSHRSSTGLLQPDEFVLLVDEFFRWPERSIRGWEPAAHAPSRVVAAVHAAAASWLASAPDAKAPNLAFVSRGAVGVLLLTHLSGAAISRDFDQQRPPPGGPPGSGGGNHFRFSLRGLELEHAWRAIDAG